MKRPGLFLTGLLALLLLGQGVASASHGLRLLPRSALTLILCTPEGLRSVSVAAMPDRATGGAPDGQDPSHVEPGACPACHALPDGLLPPAPAVAGPAWQGAASTPSGRPSTGPDAPRPKPGFAPRAPPSLA